MKKLWLFLLPLLLLTPTAQAADVTLPANGCFYYPWYPETWKQGGQHVSGADSADPNDGYTPIPLGFYDMSSPTQAPNIADEHGRQLSFAHCEVPIMSWWGPTRHDEDFRIPLLLNRWWTVSWGYLKPTIYYECEGTPATGTAGCPGAPNPSVVQIQAHLTYLQTYANHSRWARVNGKPVIFVYSSGDSACEVASRWKQAAPDWYVSLKLSSGFRDCAIQPDAWHQYGPSTAYHDSHLTHYCNVSPGFWRASDPAPTLPRDLARFTADVASCDASGAPWRLVTSFNEWGEGTAVERAHANQPGIGWENPAPTGAYIRAMQENW